MEERREKAAGVGLFVFWRATELESVPLAAANAQEHETVIETRAIHMAACFTIIVVVDNSRLESRRQMRSTPFRVEPMKPGRRVRTTFSAELYRSSYYARRSRFRNDYKQ